MSKQLQVHLHNQAIGTLTLLASGSVFFSFNDHYLNSSSRPVLSQSFYQSSGEIIAESKASAGKLPAFFSNLLPEGHMREYLAQRGGVKPSNEFRLIELLGRDLSGAVVITPIESEAITFSDAEKTTANNPTQPLRFSLAGVQLKFSAMTERRGGLTIPANGMGGDWIVKLPAQNYRHVPENEFAMMDLASRIGIPIPTIKLVAITEIGNLPEMGILAGGQALAVKRFDRSQSGMRIHIEDFAQVYNITPDKKYEGVSYGNIAAMVWTLTGESGLVDFIRRLTFCIVTGNGDMHLKNWSFIYEDGKTPTLAPAYDLLSTIPYLPQDNLALTLANTKHMKNISLEHFQKMVKKSGLPAKLVLQTVRETVDATLAAWEAHHQNYDLPAEIKNSIQRYIATLALRAK